MRKHGQNLNEWQLVADSDGRIVGHWRVSGRMADSGYLKEDIETVKRFLISLKGCQADMSKKEESTEEKTNIVWLAGKLKWTPKEFDKSVGCVIDVGLKAAIATTAVKTDKELCAKLKRFEEGDFIKVVAMVEPYGIKQEDGNWKNFIAIRVTAIKNDPPRRTQRRHDDDVPY